jgi:hypothetical protein
MSFSRFLNVRLSVSPAALVLMFSTALLLLGGCPQPAPGPADGAKTGTNNDGLAQDPGNPVEGYQAPDSADDSLDPGYEGADGSHGTPEDITPGDSGSGDQGDSVNPGDSTGGGSDDGTSGDNPPPPVVIGGDMNGDGRVDAQDIRGFVLALLDPNAYKQAYPNGDPAMADANGDGRVDAFDIDAFRKLVLGQ